MSTVSDIAKVSAKGSFHMLWGLIVSTLISSVGTIFIARLMGSDQYGLFMIVLSVPNLIGVVRNLGINSAMVRFTAKFRAESRLSEVRSVFAAGIIFEIVIGVVLSVFSFFAADFIAGAFFSRPEIVPLIQIASFYILAGGLTAAATAAFTGMEKMYLNSIMVVAQSVIKTVAIVVLVLFGLGVSGATIGHTAAAAVAGLIGVIFVLFMYKKLPAPFTGNLEIKAYTQTMLAYGIPLSFSTILSSFLAQFYVFLLPIFYLTDNSLIGNYNVALNFVVLITFFATPITTMLFPAFSKLDYQTDRLALGNAYRFSVRYSSLFVVPVAALVMCLSGPAVSTIFGSTYDSAGLFLSLLAISYLYSAFGNFSNGNLINSQGDTSFNLKLALVTACIGFPMGYLLIMNFGVLGLIATSLTACIPSLILALRFIKNKYGASVDWVSSGKILFSSGVSAVLTYMLVSMLSLASWLELFVGVLFFVVVFLFVALFSRTVGRSDVANLRGVAAGLGFIAKPVNLVLNLIEKLIVFLKL